MNMYPDRDLRFQRLAAKDITPEMAHKLFQEFYYDKNKVCLGPPFDDIAMLTGRS